MLKNIFGIRKNPVVRYCLLPRHCFVDFNVCWVKSFLGQEVLHLAGVVALHLDDITLYGAAPCTKPLNLCTEFFQVDINVAEERNCRDDTLPLAKLQGYLDALLFLGNLLADTEVFGQRTRWTNFRNF